jgi:hypothetical protein
MLRDSAGTVHALDDANGRRAPLASKLQIEIRSTSSRLTSSRRVEAWFAMAAAFSSVPLFFRYAVLPVARKV